MHEIPDPRSGRRKKHDDAAEILTCIIIGYLTGHTTLRRCYRYCVRQRKVLRKYMKLENGIASVATMSRLLSAVDEELFTYVFMEWIGELVNTKGRHLAIDGKALRGGASRVQAGITPMLLNAVDAETGIVLSQMPIQSKENEIFRIPVFLKLLDIRKSIITIDAIGTQTEIMEQIVGQGGHFVLLVKNNQPNSRKEIVNMLELLEAEKEKKEKDQRYKSVYEDFISKYDREYTTESNRDRYEYRDYRICNKKECVSKTAKEWPFIKSAGYIKQIRILKIKDQNDTDITPDPDDFIRNGTCRQPKPKKGDDEKSDIQIVGVVSDMEMTAAEMGRIRRRHWAIENKLHHVLDDTFREDRSPAKKSRNNLALIRKFAYNLLRISMLREYPKVPMTEVMDIFSDNLELLGKYIFSSIPTLT